MDSGNILNKISTGIKKYKYPLLVLLAGILFMLIPTGSSPQNESPPQTAPAIETLSIEQQLENILSQVRGAGEVKVMLTMQAGEEVIFQTDISHSGVEGAQSSVCDTVIISDDNRAQGGLVRQVNSPVYKGAIVLCQGAKDPSIRLAITDAVSKATGLGCDRISVLEMK